MIELDGGDSPGDSSVSLPLSATLPGPPPSPPSSAPQYEVLGRLEPLESDPLLQGQDDDDLCNLLMPGGWDIGQLDQLDFLLNSLGD